MVEITRIFWKRAFTADNFELGEVHSADLFLYLSLPCMEDIAGKPLYVCD